MIREHEQNNGLVEEVSSLSHVYTAVKEYSDMLPALDEFHQAVAELDNGQRLANFPPGTLPSIGSYMCRGISSSMDAVEVLVRVSDPIQREHLLKEFDEGIVPDLWIEQLVLEHAAKDPSEMLPVFPEVGAVGRDFGLNALRVVRERDMNNILKKINQGIDRQQEEGFKLHAEAVGRGHDFIIKKYSEELTANNLLPKSETTS